MQQEMYSELYNAEDIHWWFSARRKIIEKILDHFVGQTNGTKLLELGCGSGGNLEMLSKFGSVMGIETDQNSVQRARDRGICEVIQGSLPDHVPVSSCYDVVCMFDVLEHLEEDERCLEVARKILTKQGLIIVTVPAFEFLWSYHDEVNQHKRRYTKNSLETLFKRVKLNISYCGYFNTVLFPLTATHKLMGKLTNSKNIEIKTPPVIINKLLYLMFRSEALFIPKLSFPFGVSLGIVAKNY